MLLIIVLNFTIFSCNSDDNTTNTQPNPNEVTDAINPIKSPDNTTPDDNDLGNPMPEAPSPEDQNPSNPTPTDPVTPPVPETPAPEDQNPPKPDTPSTKNTSFTDEIDRAFFKQVKGFADIYDKKEIIDDFIFGEHPMYYIQTVGGDFFKTGNAIKGFVINPQSQIEGAQKLGANESFGLNIYRLDSFMKEAESKLKSPNGNGFFSSFSFNGKGKYYLQKYSKNSVTGINKTSDITTAVHEAFHILHQSNGAQNPNWEFSFNWTQDTKNFPFTKEIVELQMLTSEIFKEFPNITDKNIIRKKMKQYIAIASKELEIDPSQQKLIKNMALEQERIEGGAYYIESMAKHEFFNLKESFWGNLYGIPIKAKSKNKLKKILSFGFFYESGASVMYGINFLDKSKTAKYNSKTPFEIISEMIPMTAAEKADALNEAKVSVNWKLIQEKTVELTK